MKKSTNNNFVRRRQLTGGNRKRLINNNRDQFEEPIPTHIPFGNKMKDVTLVGTLVNTTGVTTVVDVPSQGVTYTQRVADRCYLNRLDINFNIFNNGVNTNDVLRFIVLQEIGQSTGPPIGTVFLQANTSYSPLLYNAGKLFHILLDQSIGIASNSNSSVKAMRLHVVPKIKNIQFVTGTTTPYSGQIYMYHLGSNATGMIMNLHSRLWFSDSD